MFYNAKNHRVIIEGVTTDFISFRYNLLLSLIYV